MGFTAKRHSSRTTVPAFCMQLSLVYKPGLYSARMSRQSCLAAHEISSAQGQPAGSASVSENVNEPAPLAATELHTPWRSCKKRVVSSTAYIVTRVELGTALTHDYRPGRDNSAIEHLHS